MQFLRQNTAVIVTVGQFFDKTDGVTIEGALTITNERITMTADTDDGAAPTLILDNITGAASATSNDLNYITNNDAGLMQIELSAANTNRVGRMRLCIYDAANHVPVWEDFFVLPQAIYDWLTGVIVPLPANVTTIAGSAVDAAAAQLGVNVVNWKGAAAAAMTGDAYARLGAPAGASVSADVAAVKVDTAATLADTGTDGVVVAAASKTGYALTATTGLGNQTANITGNLSGSVGSVTGHTPQTGDSFARLGAPAGASVSADIAAIEAQTDDIGAAGAGLTAVPWNAAWDAEVQSEVFDALDAAFTDATGLTANGLLDRIRTLGWIERNKLEVTDANGNTVFYKDDSTTAAFTVATALTDDSTTTTRLRIA